MNVVRLRSMWRADGDRGPLVLRYEAKNASLLQFERAFPPQNLLLYRAIGGVLGVLQ
jgi:hypothetical protein